MKGIWGVLASQKSEPSEVSSQLIMSMCIVSSSISLVAVLSISFMDSCLGRSISVLGLLLSFMNLTIFVSVIS